MPGEKHKVHKLHQRYRDMYHWHLCTWYLLMPGEKHKVHKLHQRYRDMYHWRLCTWYLLMPGEKHKVHKLHQRYRDMYHWHYVPGIYSCQVRNTRYVNSTKGTDMYLWSLCTWYLLMLGMYHWHLCTWYLLMPGKKYKVHKLHQRYRGMYLWSLCTWYLLMPGEKYVNTTRGTEMYLVEFMYLVFTRMPGESYCRHFRSLWLCVCDVFQVPYPDITLLVDWA